MTTESRARRLSAVLSADVVGFSRLVARDDEVAADVLPSLRVLVGRVVDSRGGRVVDAVGDNVLAEFPSARDAVECAAAIHGEVARHNEPLERNRRLRFRIGIDLGDVIIDGDRIVGDGVNVAARLQALAPVGGIAVSASVFEQVAGRVDVAFRCGGEQRLKNIPRTVVVYRASIDSVDQADVEPGDATRFESRPAIAVLPFECLASDPREEPFALGLAEDLIHRLSRLRFLPVVARGSSFTLAAGRIDAKKIREELGARYVIRGSIFRERERVRIRVGLEDLAASLEIWTEHFDCELEDVFVLQDEIATRVVAAIRPELQSLEGERLRVRGPGRLDAWELTQRATWHLYRLQREDSVEARSLYDQALELDPTLAIAHSGLVLSHYIDLTHMWASDPAAAVERMIHSAQASVVLDERDPMSHLAAGVTAAVTGRQAEASSAYETALEIDPSLALAHLLYGSLLATCGRPTDGLRHLDRARQLSPRDPLTWMIHAGFAMAHFAACRYDAAADCAKRTIGWKPDNHTGYAILATSSAHMGRLDEARRAIAELRRVHPEFDADALRGTLASLYPHYARRVIEGFSLAGWAK